MTYEEYCEIIDKSDFYIDSENPYDTKIIEALVKQIPRKPIHEHLNFYCPNCKNWLLWDDAEPNDNDLFCPKCGQAILW